MDVKGLKQVIKDKMYEMETKKYQKRWYGLVKLYIENPYDEGMMCGLRWVLNIIDNNILSDCDEKSECDEAVVELQSKITTSTIYYMRKHQSWGNRLGWMKIGEQIDGHMTPMVKVDDIVISAMQSGKDDKFQITKVKQCNDPRDMFFADVKFIGYVGE